MPRGQKDSRGPRKKSPPRAAAVRGYAGSQAVPDQNQGMPQMQQQFQQMPQPMMQNQQLQPTTTHYQQMSMSAYQDQQMAMQKPVYQGQPMDIDMSQYQGQPMPMGMSQYQEQNMSGSPLQFMQDPIHQGFNYDLNGNPDPFREGVELSPDQIIALKAQHQHLRSMGAEIPDADDLFRLQMMGTLQQHDEQQHLRSQLEVFPPPGLGYEDQDTGYFGQLHGSDVAQGLHGQGQGHAFPPGQAQVPVDDDDEEPYDPLADFFRSHQPRLQKVKVPEIAPLIVDVKEVPLPFRPEVLHDLTPSERRELEQLGDLDMLFYPLTDTNKALQTDGTLRVHGPYLGWDTKGHLDADGILFPADHWVVQNFELFKIPDEVTDAEIVQMFFRNPHKQKAGSSNAAGLLPWVPRHMLVIPAEHDIRQSKCVSFRHPERFPGEPGLVGEYYKQAVVAGRRHKNQVKSRWLTSSELAVNQYRLVYANLTMGKISVALAKALMNEITNDLISHQNNNAYPKNRFFHEVGMEMMRELYFWGKWVLAHGNWKAHLKPASECDDEELLERDIHSYLYSRSKLRYYSTTIKLCSWQAKDTRIERYGLQYLWTETELVERQVVERFIVRAKLRGLVCHSLDDTVELWQNTHYNEETGATSVEDMVVDPLEYELPQAYKDKLAEMREEARVRPPKETKKRGRKPAPVVIEDEGDDQGVEDSPSGRGSKRQKITNAAGNVAANITADGTLPPLYKVRITKNKDLGIFDHVDEHGAPVDINGNPAHPSCSMYTPPPADDLRWNIWTIGCAQANGGASNHRFNLRRAHYAIAMERHNEKMPPKKMSVSQLIIAILRLRAEAQRCGDQPVGWEENVAWWYYLKENGTNPEWLEPLRGKNHQIEKWTVKPSGIRMIVDPEKLERKCAATEKEFRRKVNHGSALEFMIKPPPKPASKKPTGPRRK